MIFCERLFVNLILVFCCICSTALSQLNEDLYASDLQCFGAGSQLSGICPVSSSIAIQEIRAGMRPTSQGCTANETVGDGTGCCDTAGDSCEFPFPITDNVLYHDQCNGNQACMPDVQIVDIVHAPGACNESLYPRYSQYMLFSYFCVEDSRTGGMSNSQLSVVNDALYLHSPGYPGSSIPSSVTGLSCSVETDDCSAVLNIYVIERNLADYINSSLCYQNQTLSIIEPDGTVLVQWTCSDNTYDISQPTQSTDTYITVNLTNTMTTDGGQFWIGFEANIVVNLTIDCPAKERQHCLPTTTTSTTPTTSSTANTSTTTPDSTTPAAAVNDTADIIVTPSTPIQETIMIIVVSSCLGGVLLITIIVVGAIYWKHRKENVSPEMRRPQDDNPSVRSSLNVSLPSDRDDNERFEVNERMNDDSDPDPIEQCYDNSAEADACVTISDMVTPCTDADSGRATSLSGAIEELQPMKTEELVLTNEQNAHNSEPDTLEHDIPIFIPTEVRQTKKKKKKKKKRRKKAWSEDKIESATSLSEKLPEEHIPAKALPEETELNEPTSVEPTSKTLPQSDTCIDIETPIQEVVATDSIEKYPIKQKKELAPYQRLYPAVIQGFYGDDILERKKKKRRRKRNSIKPIVKETSSP